MPRQTCSSCTHWHGHMTLDLSGWEDGVCRRYPPRGPGYGWPTTTHDEWCGEHELSPPDVDEMFAGKQ